jgi:hypothetical protein
VVRDDRFAEDAVAALDAVWSGGDVAAILECFEPDLVFVGSGEGEEAVGYDGPIDRRFAYARWSTATSKEPRCDSVA